ncbi:MAG: bifunctional phosphopantothenoylcysteine decarboxylase/phosphopantothenate--cysteine ligase CoaBC [Nitriliruptorales bacterium]|nr:bifunctional phosphopantothenoylcysteine decarboxylase/phosphopantothenate--cysteine ligase CoaBC [Nitriliruptorales bacterium]
MPDPGDDVTAGLAGARVVLGVSGGIAAYKAAVVARLLVKAGAHVDTVLTRGAQEFVGSATFEGITGRPARTEVWDDVPDDTHVALARAADVVAVYPATAHTLAKAASGLADDLLTTTLLAATCPVLVAPAMHTEMWQHAATVANVARLEERGVRLVGPAEGELMGGDVGAGRAVEPDEFVAAVAEELTRAHDLDGRVVVVTAGGTREHLDPVRYLGNRSSGKMGFAVARQAARRGAVVHLVAAPTHLDTPAGVIRHDVVSAREMRKEVVDLVSDADVVVKAAAVADFRPASASERKLKKADGTPQVELERNPDILAELGEERAASGRARPLLVGFAAETNDAEANGRDKLERKNADLLVVNDVSRRDAGFEVDTNRVVILGRDGGRVEVPLTTKAEVAARVLDEVAARFG